MSRWSKVPAYVRRFGRPGLLVLLMLAVVGLIAGLVMLGLAAWRLCSVR
jgi:cation transporter-like permease